MKRSLFPGRFDPPSLGHLSIIERSAGICDRLYVGVADVPKDKQTHFSTEERMRLLKTITASLPTVEVICFSGLVVDCVKQYQIDFLVRGLRLHSDFDEEFRMATTNRLLSGIDTLFLMAESSYTHLSATLIREIARLGHDLHGFVPDSIESEVFERLHST